MDQMYNVKRRDISLETRCAVKVAYQTLLGSGFYPKNPGDTTVISKAIDRVMCTKFSLNLKETVVGLIPRICCELKRWCTFFEVDVLPVLTAQGTVDLWQSSKNIVDDEKVDKRTRFIVACVFCHEEMIFELGSMMSSDELENVRSQTCNRDDCISSYHHQFTNFWLLQVFNSDNGGRSKPCLSQIDHNAGLLLSVMHANGYAFKYFINKVASEQASDTVNMTLRCALFNFFTNEVLMSPATCCLMHSLLKKEQWPDVNEDLSYLILSKLGRWPYQKIFVRAAESLVPHLSVGGYWDILIQIVLKITSNRKGHDYMETYIKFWDIGEKLMGNQRFFEEESCSELFDNILCSNNMTLINHLLIEIPDIGRDMLLLYFVEKHISFVAMCVSESRYWFLDIFIRSCSMKRNDTLLKFKRNCNIDTVSNAAVRKRGLQIVDEIVGKILEELQLEEMVVSHSANLNHLILDLLKEWFDLLMVSTSLLS